MAKTDLHEPGESRQRVDEGWIVTLGGVVIAGLIAVVAVALNASDPGAVSGVAFLLAGSCLLVGVLIGFIFGIPRALQRGEPEEPAVRPDSGAPKTEQRKEREGRYGDNTNLEQISDWLAKILVGVGLTQLGDVPANLAGAGKYLGPALGSGTAAEGLAIGILVYFPTAGFLLGYLWTRLFLAGALTRALTSTVADLEERVEAQEQQAKLDASALALVEKHLTGDASARITPDELKAAIKKASPSVKVQAFYRANKVRRENWEGDKPVMERSIPIFEALVESDVEKRFHENHGQLGYALKDKTEPDWAKAEEALTRAIRIRGPWQETGWALYEANRAVCRIHTDVEFKAGKSSLPANKERIIEDLRVIAYYAELEKWLQEQPIADWLKLNKIRPTTLQSE
jgi:hypothetical protein